jgi:hypothetical protein
MSTNFAKEFKLYEDMFFGTDGAPLTEAIGVADKIFKTSLTKKRAVKNLNEARSVADIEAEIARLQAELADAKVAEKKASYGGSLPKTVWVWDIYLDPSEKGSWVSIDNDMVFETKEKALDAAWVLLGELDDQDDLDEYGEGIEPDDYTIGAYEIPISKVSDEILEYSNLAHLVDNPTANIQCCECNKIFRVAKSASECKCPKCGVELDIHWN